MADIIVRVVYEGSTVDLDIDNNIPLRLDISSVENQAIGKFFGVGSQTFDLPGTKENNRFFKHGYTVGATDIPAFYNSITGYIIYNGETVLDGQFQLLEIITDDQGYVTYKCRITDQVVTFNDALGSKLIKNADWSDLDHDLTYANITGSWDNGLLNGSVYYPLAFYGFENPDNIQLPYFSFLPQGTTAGNYLDNRLTPIQASQCLPAVRVKDTLDKIFDQVDFRYTGSFTTGSDFDNLYILPKAEDGLGIIGEPGQLATCYAYASLNQNCLPGTVQVVLDQEQSDPTNAFDTNTWSYSIGSPGNYTFTGQTAFFNPFSFSGNGSVTLTMMRGTTPGGSGTVISTVTRNLSSADGFNIINLSVGGTVNASSTSKVWVDITFNVVQTSGRDAVTLLGYSTNFQCTTAPAATLGATVNMGLQFGGNTKSIDILNGLIEQFNLVLTPVKGNSKLISIDSFDTWIRSGDKKDWTNKYDTSERIGINHTVDEQPKELFLKNTDDTDRFSKAALESDPNYQYGTLRLIADNNVSQGTRTIGDYFAPTVLGGPFKSDTTGTGTNGDGTLQIDVNNTFVFPHLYKYENSKPVSYAFKPRIGYKVNAQLPKTIYIGPTGGGSYPLNGNYATISNVASLPVTSTTNDLLFNNTYTTFTQTNNLNGGVNAYTNYWATYIESLYWEDSTKVTIDLEFEQNEYYTINLNDRIFIKDTYYRINKISGFNLSSKDVATVELIKLYPAYFDGQTNEGCTFSVVAVSSDEDCIGNTPTPVPTFIPTSTPVPTSSPTPTPTYVPGAPTPTPIPATPTPAPTSTNVPGQPTPSPIPPTGTPVPTSTPVIPTATPVPTPANLFEFYVKGHLTEGDECFENTVQLVYTTDFSDVNDIQAGDIIYTNSSLTTQLNDSYWYGAANTDNSLPVKAFQYLLIAGVSNLGDCNVGTPVSMSSYHLNNLDACNDTTPEFTAYVSGNVDPQNIQVGDIIYSNPQLTNTFGFNNVYYGVYNGVQSTPIKSYLLFEGEVQSSFTCGIPTATPTATPTPTPLISYPVDASEFSVNTALCGQPTVNTFYTDKTVDLWTQFNVAFYTDPELTTGVVGQNRYVRLTSSSFDQVWSLNNNGLLSEFGRDCGEGLFTFYGTTCRLSFEDACDFPITRTLYTTDFTSVEDIQNGDKIYVNSDLTTELADNCKVAISDTYQNTGNYSRSGNYSLNFGWNGTELCAAPTAGPTPTPTPTPFVSYEYALSTGSVVNDVCSDPVGDQYVYTDRNSTADIVNRQGTFYTDANLTIPFDGNDLWYGVAAVGSGFANIATFVNNNTGNISTVFDCGPTPTPPVFITLKLTPGQVSNTTCFDQVYAYTVYSPATSLADIDANGTTLYTDTSLTTPFDGDNLWFGFASGSDTIATYSGLVNNVTGVVTANNFAACGPTPTPIPSYAYGVTDAEIIGSFACNELTTGVVYTLDFADLNSISEFDKLYTDQNLTIPFEGGGNYFGLTTNTAIGSTPTAYVRYNTISGVTVSGSCGPIPPTPTPTGTPGPTPTPSSTPTPTPTTSPTPTPSPSATPTVYALNRTTGQTIQGIVCGATATAGDIYTYKSRGLNLQVGDVVYSDAAFTTPFNGGNNYYGIGTEISTDPEREIRVDAGGNVTYAADCPPDPTPTPTPTATLAPVQIYRSSNGYGNSASACADTSLNVVYSTADVPNLNVNDYVYTNSALTNPFNGGVQYWALEAGAGPERRAALIQTDGRISQLINC